MITRLMRLALWIGHSGTSAMIAAQFGLAMMPLCSRIRPALISGTTSGTSGSMRKAEELSTTTAPAFTAIGRELPGNAAAGRKQRDVDAGKGVLGEFLDHDPLAAEVDGRCRPSGRCASAFSLPTRKPRRSMVAMNSAPTAPVTPAMATTGSFVTLVSI